VGAKGGKKMRRNRGLSIWSVLLVIAIVGTLVGLMWPSVNSAHLREENKSYSKDELIGDAYARENAQLRTMSASAQRTFESQSVKASPTASARYQRMGSVDQSISLAQNLEEVEVSRKIIYEADVTVVVKDVGAAEKELLAQLKELGGYIAEAMVNRVQGEQLSGQWRVRIPVDKFEEFLDSISHLGITENRRQTAQDVTEEYVDLEAQIANKQKLEERIIGLLEKSTGKISDVIAVEHELGRIRNEIERMEGRLKFLSNRTDMTTVSISFREEQEYVPEQAPALSSRIGETWDASLTTLGDFGERLLLATVAASPWIAITSVILVPTFLFASKRLQGKKLPQ
jgi:NACalpha-BTF3-like transcription factor